MRLNPKQICSYTGGSYLVEPIDARELLTGITWDSREVSQGDLYLAFPGERTDGHRYVAAALRAGARGALVQEPIDASTRLLAAELGCAVIEVANTAAALTDLARAWRGFLRGRVIGITGSAGKTTTKNFVRDVLASAVSVVATEGNQNNELGVPKTILKANPETDAVVVEMGMRGAGQIRELCDFVKPDLALITNIGESHIELLGSREHIARAKAELIEALPPAGGIAILNGADDLSALIYELTRRDCTSRTATVCFDGSGNFAGPEQLAEGDWRCGPAVWAEDIEIDGEGRPHFTLVSSGFAGIAASGAPDPALDLGSTSCTLALRGEHNVANACAAAAVGCVFGIDLPRIAQALEISLPEAGRQEIITARGGFIVINDSYNANPDSMRAALSVLCAMEVSGKRVAVLGDMAELGTYARACHEGIGRDLVSCGIDELVCVGDLAKYIAAAAREAGMPADSIAETGSVSGALEVLEVMLEAGDAVLVKASHCMELERVVRGLVN